MEADIPPQILKEPFESYPAAGGGLEDLEYTLRVRWNPLAGLICSTSSSRGTCILLSS